jgi:hypothetical protein
MHTARVPRRRWSLARHTRNGFGPHRARGLRSWDGDHVDLVLHRCCAGTRRTRARRPQDDAVHALDHRGDADIRRRVPHLLLGTREVRVGRNAQRRPDRRLRR